MVKRVKIKAHEGPKKTVWVPAKYGTGGTYKVVPVNKVKESVEVEPMQLEATRIPFLLMTANQKRNLFEEVNQLEFDGVQTKNMDQCPGAYKEFKAMIETVRAGKHIGELAGHEPAPAANVTTQNSVAATQVQAGMAVKPERMRQMQFRQYVGL